MYSLITRPKEDSINLANKLAALKLTTFIEPMLEISIIDKNKSILTKALNDYNIIIVTTSSNAIKALGAFTKNRSIMLIVVGKKSELIAKNLGFENIIIANGSATCVIDLISNAYNSSCINILYLSSNHITIDLAYHLKNLGFNVKRIIIYKSKAVRNFSLELIDAIKDNKLSHVLFFSNRTASIFLKLVSLNNLSSHLTEVKAFTLSENIAKIASVLKWKEIFISQEATEESLIESIMGNL